jgi:uncharacterized membrane protein
VTTLPTLDLVAVGWFLICWLIYGYVVDASPLRRRSLSHVMDGHRRVWISTMAVREMRMVDTAIMTGLQNGTAFFASTSALAIGAAFAVLNSTDRIAEVISDISPMGAVSPVEWEAKGFGLMLIYAYAFFKFGWAYRLFNYASILIGAVPQGEEVATPAGQAAVERAADMIVIAGRHFNRGLRAMFLSVGLLGWFAGPWAFLAATTFIVAVLARRQFASRSLAAALHGAGDPPLPR